MMIEPIEPQIPVFSITNRIFGGRCMADKWKKPVRSVRPRHPNTHGTTIDQPDRRYAHCMAQKHPWVGEIGTPDGKCRPDQMVDARPIVARARGGITATKNPIEADTL